MNGREEKEINLILLKPFLDIIKSSFEIDNNIFENLSGGDKLTAQNEHHFVPFSFSDDFKLILGFCPHCYGTIEIPVDGINCKIFRHGTYKHSGEQIGPHASFEECSRLINQNLIYGCGRPFKLDIDSKSKSNFSTKICGYE